MAEGESVMHDPRAARSRATISGGLDKVRSGSAPETYKGASAEPVSTIQKAIEQAREQSGSPASQDILAETGGNLGKQQTRTEEHAQKVIANNPDFLTWANDRRMSTAQLADEISKRLYAGETVSQLENQTERDSVFDLVDALRGRQ